MLYFWEVRDAVVAKTGIRLNETPLTDRLLTYNDPERLRRCELFGPFVDPDGDPELRIFVSVSEVDGCKPSLQLLVQDCEDDWLNSNALGAEKYRVGPIHV